MSMKGESFIFNNKNFYKGRGLTNDYRSVEINSNLTKKGEVLKNYDSKIVDKRATTTRAYTSDILYNDINGLKQTYPFIEVGDIGRSVLDRAIPYVRIGNGKNKVFYSAGIHANEWITSPILMKFLEDCCLSVQNNEKLFGYDVNAIFNRASLYVVPMCNPDGVDLVTGRIQIGDKAYSQAQIIANNFPQIEFTRRLESQY